MYFSLLPFLYIAANIVNFLHILTMMTWSRQNVMLHFYLLFSFNISIEIIARDLLLQSTNFKGIGLYKFNLWNKNAKYQVFNFLTWDGQSLVMDASYIENDDVMMTSRKVRQQLEYIWNLVGVKMNLNHAHITGITLLVACCRGVVYEQNDSFSCSFRCTLQWAQQLYRARKICQVC